MRGRTSSFQVEAYPISIHLIKGGSHAEISNTYGNCCFISFGHPIIAGQSAEDEAAIRKVVEQLYAALNKKDIKAAFALCDENFENYTGTLKGREANEKRWGPIFATRFKNVQYKQFDEIGIQFITPDAAIYKDRYDFTGALDADGIALPHQSGQMPTFS